ncbi:hsp70-binding protein 1-like [Atheta coriaria]|uniref:hsp70-binding protein 1-like n=1 Tax=Dalotia coriaria TaxID=877792 RepID=UPI0031F3A37D
MPGVPEKKHADASGDQIPQPRQPQNLQGLLRFAMEAQDGATQSTPQLQPLDDERRNFLQAALQSMSVDVIAIMKENITKLQQVEDISDDKVPEMIEAFDCILDYIDNIDIANDFHKINGFSIFEPCLRCKHDEIRARVCDLIAELSQNNPYIQGVICECTNVLPKLLNTLRHDECQIVKIKALYAISCITRESLIGYGNFQTHNGLEALRSALETGNDKLRTKAAFLLSALHNLDGNLHDSMLSMGFLPVIVDILQGEHQSSHEHLLSLLKSLLIDNKNKIGDKLTPDLRQQLLGTLQSNLEFVRGKEEFSEEQEYCEQLQRFLMQQ